MSTQQRETLAGLLTTLCGLICWGLLFYNIYQGVAYAGTC